VFVPRMADGNRILPASMGKHVGFLSLTTSLVLFLEILEFRKLLQLNGCEHFWNGILLSGMFILIRAVNFMLIRQFVRTSRNLDMLFAQLVQMHPTRTAPSNVLYAFHHFLRITNATPSRDQSTSPFELLHGVKEDFSGFRAVPSVVAFGSVRQDAVKLSSAPTQERECFLVLSQYYHEHFVVRCWYRKSQNC
jgi:hypothetical protein